jgi:hypothetical protein
MVAKNGTRGRIAGDLWVLCPPVAAVPASETATQTGHSDGSCAMTITDRIEINPRVIGAGEGGVMTRSEEPVTQCSGSKMVAETKKESAR